MSRTIAVADIGGTHARFALAEVGAGRVVSLGEPITLRTSEHASFQTAWHEFGHQLGAALPDAIGLAKDASAEVPPGARARVLPRVRGTVPNGARHTGPAPPRTVRRSRPDSDIVQSGQFAIEQCSIGHCHDAGIGIDRKPSTCVVKQRISHCIRRRIGIACRSRDPNRRAVGGILINLISPIIPIQRGGDVELIDVADVDRKDRVGG